MKRRLLDKVRSQAGESIAEVLVALLISSIALVMLASMISSTTNMVNNSKTTMEKYYACNNDLEKLNKTQDKTTELEDFSITIETGSTAVPALKVTDDTVKCFENASLGHNVYAYG